MVVCFCAVVRSASAQSANVVPGTVEISGSMGFQGATPLGSQDATLTVNGPGATSSSFVLFETSTEIDRAAGFAGRLGYVLTRIFAVEGVISFARARVFTSVRNDFENSSLTPRLEEELSRYLVEAGVVMHLPRWAFAQARALPFVTGSVGYLRELHEGGALVQTGRSLHVGGGLKYFFLSRRDGLVNTVGARVEARAVILDGGFDMGRGSRRYVTVSAGAFLGF